MAQPKYKRILVKLSGEALLGDAEYGIHPEQMEKYAKEIKAITEMGVEVALVIGGGNIFRGVQGVASGMDRTQSDHMGMLATVINSLALQDVLEHHDVSCRVQSALTINEVAEPFIRRRSIRHLEKSRVVILAAGTGNPYFTTDTAAVLRAAELHCDVVMKATRVDGVYTADPEKDVNATKFDEISFADVISKRLNVMDMTAFTMCQENALPLIIFDINKPGSLSRAVKGEAVGTLVS